MLTACGNSTKSNSSDTDSLSSVAAASISEEDSEKIIDFLMPIFTPTNDFIHDEAWLNEHCTEQFLQYLTDAYAETYEEDDDDEPGYAAWELEGQSPGEDCASDLTSIAMTDRNGKPCVKVELHRYNGSYDVIRTLYYECLLVDGKVMINSLEWGKDKCGKCLGTGTISSDGDSLQCPACDGEGL